MFRKLRQQYYTMNWIREAVNACPDGICMAEQDGRPILANRTINALSMRLTGHTVMNAASFWDRLKEQAEDLPEEPNEVLLLRVGQDAVWQCRRQQVKLGHGVIWQYQVSDVTRLYEYRERLKENNLRTEQLHDRQRGLIRGIVRNNQEKERLRAKMRIHDEMGQVLLMTRQAMENEKNQEEETLFCAWERVVNDLKNAAREQEQEERPPEQELSRIAAMIGCRVIFTGQQPTERKALLLLYAAIREALTNAVRHAGADLLSVQIREEPTCYRVSISDNGRTERRQPLREGSGLSNLRRRLEEEGASMWLESEYGVVMHLEIPKE